MATYHVPGDAATIQGGINLAGAGDTVIVAPGTYVEALVIDESITLISSGGPLVTIIDPPSSEYYLVSIEASNVTFSGFTVTNPDYNANADASGILTYNALKKSNIHITNCIIHDIGTMTRSPVSFGTYGINSGPVDGLEVDNTVVYNIGNGDGTSEAVGIFVWGNGPADAAENINIHDNHVYNIINPSPDNSGIRLGADTTNVIIANNTITPTVKQGIVTSAGMIGPVTITGNTVDGALLYGLLLRSPFPQTVTGNTIKHTVGTGILITATSFPPEIHFNNIFGNGTGLDNQSPNIVNAANNWWGASTGPNTPGADTVVGITPVDFAPWLKGPYPPLVRGVSFW